MKIKNLLLICSLSGILLVGCYTQLSTVRYNEYERYEDEEYYSEEDSVYEESMHVYHHGYADPYYAWGYNPYGYYPYGSYFNMGYYGSSWYRPYWNSYYPYGYYNNPYYYNSWGYYDSYPGYYRGTNYGKRDFDKRSTNLALRQSTIRRSPLQENTTPNNILTMEKLRISAES